MSNNDINSILYMCDKDINKNKNKNKHIADA